MRIKWVAKALSNLVEITEYIAKDDLEIAKKIAAHIRESVADLARQPNLGRQGRVYGTRELVLSKYPFIIPYRVKDGELQILAVFHTSRKPPKKW